MYINYYLEGLFVCLNIRLIQLEKQDGKNFDLNAISKISFCTTSDEKSLNKAKSTHKSITFDCFQTVVKKRQ